MLVIDPITKIVTMDEEEYLTITGHIKECEHEITMLKNRLNMVEGIIARH